MAQLDYTVLRPQLLERRERLQETARHFPHAGDAIRLLKEVDAALERMNKGIYGLCDVCHEPVEEERLMADPLTRVCLDHLSVEQQRALEQDLDLTSRIQATLLPPNPVRAFGWEISYHYEPVGPVGGDYCDIIMPASSEGPLLFALGDVSGKGLPASMLVAHLHAMIHSLAPFDLSLKQVMARANRLLCESSLTSHYATLVCGRLDARGNIEVCNAGHFPPVLVRNGKTEAVDATGVPVGLFCDVDYEVISYSMSPGDTLFLYTDGLCEAWGKSGEYGIERVRDVVRNNHRLPSAQLLAKVVHDVREFMAGEPLADDLTLAAIRRVE